MAHEAYIVFRPLPALSHKAGFSSRRCNGKAMSRVLEARVASREAFSHSERYAGFQPAGYSRTKRTGMIKTENYRQSY